MGFAMVNGEVTQAAARAIAARYGLRPTGTYFAATLGANASEAEQIQAVLSSAGIAPNDVQAAVTQYTGLAASQQNAMAGAVATLASGGKPSFQTFAPFIAGGLALSGVGAPVVAAIAALLPLVDTLANALGLTLGSPSCTWKVGALCFTGKRPYGPIDPTSGKANPLWTTWSSFTRDADSGANPGGGLGALDPPTVIVDGRAVGPFERKIADDTVDAAFPLYRWSILCDEPALRARIASGQADARDQFTLVYYAAWKANAEYAINGHPYAKPYDLLTNVQSAWNATHAAGAGAVLQPSDATPLRQGDGYSNCLAPGQSYIGALLNGILDGDQHPPLAIHNGDAIAPPPFIAPHLPGSAHASSGASSSSPVKTAAIATAAVAAAGVGAWFALGQPLTIHAAKIALSHAWRSLRGK